MLSKQLLKHARKIVENCSKGLWRVAQGCCAVPERVKIFGQDTIRLFLVCHRRMLEAPHWFFGSLEAFES